MHFIRALLQEDPVRRMSLTDALDHPWLKSYIPVHESSDQLLLGAGPSTSSAEVGASAGVSHQFIGLQIQPSASAPLQRRSVVLSQAAEEGRAISEPTPDMIATANAKESKRNKRVRANLTPLQEEGDAGPSSRAGSSSSGNGKAPKRARLRSDN